MMTNRRVFLSTLAAVGAAPMLAKPVMAAETVVVYSAISTKLMQAFVESFQKLNPGTTVQVISGGSGELLTRIKAERNNPRGDILLGPDADTFDSDLGLFASYVSKEAAAFDPAAVQKDHKYSGLSTNFQVFIVNTKLMPLDQTPKTWKDLVKPEFKGKVLMANPAQSGSAFSQLHQILALYGWDVMDQIIANATFVSSSKLAFQNIAKGEIPLGLTSEFNVLQSKADGDPVEAVYPQDGTALIVDASAIIANGPNPEAAKRFIDFVNSKQAHELLVSIDKRRSARKDVAPPPGLTPISAIKVVPYDTVSAAKDKGRELERFDQAFSKK
ncbi:extracellular solute-binding protein [Microvirga alba]|uniref:Extracellular solute-binding protein n=1 Tax=Microvirga alba TaxID=2791025 RepID=A0A931FUM5_9HYPH|nr:extracellular solute-binding protein [Microvirga alba]MBF9235761.1 extracellular solute-binding protein [Microvirga alba]